MGKVVPFRKKKKKSKKKRIRAPHSGSQGTRIVWQAALVRLPTWVQEKDDEPPHRAWSAMALSLTRDLIAGPTAVRQDECSPSQVADALRRLAETCGEWPDVVEVRDPELVAHLEKMPELEGVQISHRPTLAGLDGVLAEFARTLDPERRTPPPSTSVPGVTVEHMRSFAVAAERFYAAAPWRELENDDVIRVESPVPDPNLRHLTVMGAAGEEFGVLFLEHGEDFLRMGDEAAQELLSNQALWSVSFWEPAEIDFRDHDLWEDEALPVVEDGLIPVAVCFGPKRRVRRASPKLLAFFESVLIALSESTVEELDSGSWEREVDTGAGRTTVAFSLVDFEDNADTDDDFAQMPPRMLMERHLRRAARLAKDRDFSSPEEFEALLMEADQEDQDVESTTDPREAAQDLAYKAMEARGRRRKMLARQALDLWPDCVDALGVLAEEAPDLDHAIELFEQAVAAGEKELGTQYFTDDVGHFWGLVETRPYMRARLSLGLTLWAAGRYEEAVGHYRELLRLNPNDNQGVRDLLTPALVGFGELEAAEQLLTDFKETHSAVWHYSWALLTFLKEGDGRLARRRLTDAFKWNSHVPDLLIGLVPLPPEPPPYFKPGETTEAVAAAFEIRQMWTTSEGAMAWIEQRWNRYNRL